jgi:phosphatidylserine decarboxylase
VITRALVYLQYLLPKYSLTVLVHWFSRIRLPAVKNFLITQFVRLYKVDLEEVRGKAPEDFATLNEFFVRELAAGARPIEGDSGALLSPVDGQVSQAGALHGSNIVQAKGLTYTLEDLLATDLDAARSYAGGRFATIYLAPHNYHRVHSPFDGELDAMRYVPGDLFSVNSATAALVPGLFRRNERLVMHFSTARGPAAIILVGALHVGSISTPWTGQIRPRKSGLVDPLPLGAARRELSKGDLLGWFNMGSTVIVLMPPGSCEWIDDLQPGQPLKMGEAIGYYLAVDG